MIENTSGFPAVPVILAYRGDDNIATVGVGAQSFHAMMLAAQLCATGFGADQIVCTSDMFHALVPVNPRTWSTWQPMEMAECADLYEGRENGWVEDVLTVCGVNRAGDIDQVQIAYTPEPGGVQWKRPTEVTCENTGNGCFHGDIPDMLRSYMGMPSFTIPPGALDRDPPEVVQARVDVTIAEVLTRPGELWAGLGLVPNLVGLSARPGSARARVIEESGHVEWLSNPDQDHDRKYRAPGDTDGHQ
jgi:hypothetical protein